MSKLEEPGGGGWPSSNGGPHTKVETSPEELPFESENKKFGLI